MLLFISINAQTYAEQWIEIEKLEKSRLPKSALKKVELIYQKAKDENNSSQLIKAIIHKKRYISTLNRNSDKSSIVYIEKEIKETTNRVTKLILKSILAEMYVKQAPISYDYSDKTSPIVQEFLDKASRLYLESLGEEAKYVKIEEYKSILTYEENTKGLRPTLYDLLAFRALKHFRNSRSYLHKPIYNFYLKDKEAFASITSFINYQFQTPNRDSYKYKSLLIYQKLLQFHKSQKDLKALQHINFERINFVYRNFVGDKKEQYYIEALTSLESQHIYSEALYYLAKYYFHKGDYRKAIGYAKRGIKNSDKYISEKCLFIKQHIELQFITFHMEKVNLPNENILAKITYQNIDKLFVKVIKVREKEQKRLDSIEPDSLDNYILGLDTINEFNLSLPRVDDYKEHNTEISLGSYGLGHYIFLISKDREFTKFTKSFSAISKIAYFHKNSKLMIVDRESGKPLEGVEAKLYLSKYNRKTKESKIEFISKKISNKNGIVTLPKIEYEYQIHLKYGEDSLNFARGTSYNQIYDRRYKNRKTLQFFTDRAIYRPSQTIYFKALAIERGKKSKILVDEEVEVHLYNSNGQKIESKKFRTNEFGTVNGFFILPKRGRLGSMHLSSNLSGSKIIRVEEYKRAKFEVSFLKLEKSYRLGDSISVKGIANAFAGNRVDDAVVKYSIKRTSHLPSSQDEAYQLYSPVSIEIDRGEVKTDQEGRFTINFNALPDKSISVDKKPNYTYTISVDITDSTGETQSSTKSINLGFEAIKASIIIDDEINIESNISLRIESRNFDGKFEPIQGKITVERFKERERLYRDRYWSITDIDMPLYTKEKFSKLFKNYKPIDISKREKELIKSINFNTKESKSLSLGELTQGEYLLTLHTVDRYGTEIKNSKKIIIYNLNASKPPLQTQLWNKTDKEEYDVNSTATLYIKSSSPKSFVYLSIEKDGEIVQERWIELSKLNRELIEIRESDRGDIFYYINMIKNSREYRSFNRIRVPWRKKLKVEYRSFRDKLEPNQKEQWSIKISGEDRERVVAEIVATMYDASLDKIIKHNFNIENPFPNNQNRYENRWEARTFFQLRDVMDWGEHRYRDRVRRVFSHIDKFNSYRSRYPMRNHIAMLPVMAQVASSSPIEEEADIVYESAGYRGVFMENISDMEGDGLGGGIDIIDNRTAKPVIRKNLKETMFFKPNLRTDKDGNIIINFKTNEALTRWKFLAFAHTKDLKTVITQKEIVTQKELMVVTNLPRFFREGDIITLSAKVVNMSQKDLTGICQLKLQNPENGWNIYGDHNFSKKIFLKKGASTKVNFKIRVPQADAIPAIKHTIIAKTELYSDAEQIIRPILSNREFITETKALSIRGKETKSFTLESLKNSNSTTLKNHKLTLEFTSNPIWYAIKSLPYLMEYPHECSEQLFNRYFANALASQITNSTPKIKKVLNSWRDKKELKSPLTKNQELKTLLLEETPWVLEAEDEERQQRSLALLFDIDRLAKERDSLLSKLSKRQQSSGGWAWFNGARENWYITQYIVEGFGKLESLGVKYHNKEMIKKAINYMDRRVLQRYKELEKFVKKGDKKFESNNIDSIIIHYLYTRGLYQFPIGKKIQKAYNYYLIQAENYWTEQNLYEQGMVALTLYKKGKRERAEAIVKSLKERALVDSEMGMYFKYKDGFYWNQMPIETHALMIEVFNNITKDKKSVEQLKIWLLKNKQTSHWKTTKATASAIYALLLNDSWLSNDKLVDINFDTKIEYQPILQKAKALAEKGSGYFKVSFNNFNKDMATVRVKNPNKNIAWGGLYWQYFEDLNKIKSFKETPLKVEKRLYLLRGDTTTPIEKSVLKIGDKIKVKIELSTDRDIEYIMIKDGRASAFEPTNTLSQYRWQNGLGYYESTKENATYFFIDYLKRGTYSFEYTLFITHSGSFANGITTVESVYAPEFKTHSKGEQINVK
jgi:uncharacterized protein YfaS (alpha-2-macroglobulin family)